MLMYISWKVDLNSENKFRILQMSKKPEHKVKYQINGHNHLGTIVINQNLDTETVYNVRVVVGNVKDPTNFKLYYNVYETIKQNEHELFIGVFVSSTLRTRSINEHMRYAVVGNDLTTPWNNEKLKKLKKDNIITHGYMFGNEIIIRIFEENYFTI